MKKKLIDSLIKNWPAKIICFTIAVFLYLFYQASLIEKKTFTIPLTVIENGLVVHIGDIPTAVVVSVRASENDIKSVFPSEIKASVNLNNIVTSGTYRVPIDISISEKLMEIDPLELKLKEEKIKIVVERNISNFVKVTPSIVGNIAENYEISDVTMDPPYVQIEGPESLVNEITEIKTERVNVSNAKTPFSVETTYMRLSELLRIVDNDKSCKATITVVPKVIEKEFTNVPIKVINLNEDLEVLSILPVFNIKLKGSIPDFNNFEIRKNPLKLDLSSVILPGEYEIPVNITVPGKFELIDKSSDTIFVRVELKKTEEDIENKDNNTVPGGVVLPPGLPPALVPGLNSNINNEKPGINSNINNAPTGVNSIS